MLQNLDGFDAGKAKIAVAEDVVVNGLDSLKNLGAKGILDEKVFVGIKNEAVVGAVCLRDLGIGGISVVVWDRSGVDGGVKGDTGGQNFVFFVGEKKTEVAVDTASAGGGDGHRISDEFGTKALECQWRWLADDFGERLVRKGEIVHRTEMVGVVRVARRCVGAGGKREKLCLSSSTDVMLTVS